jgi:sugar phosphate isomerase/epimerase
VELGIFETVFSRPTLGGTFDAVVSYGLRTIQLDLVSAGLSSLPAQVPANVATAIHDEAERRDIGIAAVGGMYNMIHPDPGMRERGLASLRTMAAAAPAIGTSLVTLCTGTRDRESMWRRHPENDTPSAWRDLRGAIDAALEIAEAHDLTLGVEPEPANVMRDARAARRLLDETGSDRLKIVMDPANILAGDRSRSPELVLDETFDLLGNDIVLAHAKDLSADGQFCAAGHGIVPWGHVLSLLLGAEFDGALILHTLTEADVPHAVAMLRELMRERGMF